MASLEQSVVHYKKKCKALLTRARRQKTTVKRLRDVVKDLRDKRLLQRSAEELINDACPDKMSLTLFKHLLQQHKRHKNTKRYSSDVKKFAVTLHYLSPAAYEYVRPTLSLPHASTLRTWKSSITCEPGLLTNALESAQKLAEAGDNMCSLIVDEMNIKKEIIWCPQRNSYSGHVDFGGGPVNDTVASSALVFMLVSISAHWKTPIAYFLTDHIDSETLANSVKEAIISAADHGLIVKTVVADGLKANLKAARLLGCQICCENPSPYFNHPHPSFCREKIYYICDPPHMLKLIRNLLAEYGSISAVYDTGNKIISWKYIKALHDLQSQDCLYLANKLRSRHIDYQNVKMKVNVAAQTLSASVASAIDHLRDDLQLPQFKGSEETCKFIRIVDKLFDVLNSKNPVLRGQKGPLRSGNKAYWQSFLMEAISYLKILHDRHGKSLHQTPRGQAITGFVITATATLELASDLLDRQLVPYFLTYKFSQDHLEMFFSKIRRRHGWNNNPTAEQFKASLRTLMVRNDIKSSELANAVDQDGSRELQIDFPLLSHKKKGHTIVHVVEDQDFMVAVDQLEASFSIRDEDWRYSCLTYTAGFVSKKLKNNIKCPECAAALLTSEIPTDIRFSFLTRRNNDGLVCPSDGVVKVLQATEQAFRLIIPNVQHLPHTRYVDLQIQALVLYKLKDKYFTLFPSLQRHFFDHELLEEDHITKLLKTIINYYLKMRLFKAGKIHHQRFILKGIATKRIKLNKLTLFSGQ